MRAVKTMPAPIHASLIATTPATPTPSWADNLKAGQLPPWVAPGLAAAGIVLGLVIITMQVRTDRRQRAARRELTAAPPAQPPRRETAPVVADAEPLREVMRDAEELMDRLAARTEAQADRLEALIARAEESQQRLAEVNETAARPPVQPVPPPAQPIAAQPGFAPAPVYAAAVVEPKPRAPVAAELTTGDRYQNVYQLADQGLSSAQIAKQLGQPKGEIELILGLRKG